MLGESWGGTSRSAGRRGPMSFESLAMSVCVASLGLFIETRWAPSLVLETPLTACLLPKRDPFVFFPPDVLLHSYMVMVVFFFCLFVSFMENLGNTGKYFKKSPIFLSPLDIHCYHLCISFQKEDFKKKVNVEPYQRSLEIKNGLFKIPKIQ